MTGSYESHPRRVKNNMCLLKKEGATFFCGSDSSLFMRDILTSHPYQAMNLGEP